MMMIVFLTLFLIPIVFCSDVIEFTEANFDDEIKELDVALVEFYAPWCGHCKKLAPEYEKAATKLKSNSPPIALAKVDCTAEKSVCDKFGVGGFPTLKIFRNGEVSQDYDGPREADGIVKYMRGQSGPSSKELNSMKEFKDFAYSVSEHTIVGFFESESKLKDSYLKVADTERDRFQFAHTTDASILKETGYTDDIVIFVPKSLHNKFEDSEIKYDGNYDTDKIKKFIVKEMHGLAGFRTSDNSWQFDKKPLVVVYYQIDFLKDPKGTSYWRNRVLKVAKDYRRRVHFAVSNVVDFGTELEAHGLDKDTTSKKPLVAAQTSSGKYPMTAEFSVDSLKQFVDDLLADSLEGYMKSEAIPESQGNVKVLVAKNFKELIEKADKDALIEFYAPWCGHCKKLVPIYDELGDKMANENVIIAKMDATANDVPPMFEVRGFPTLYWLPKNAKTSPQSYQGGREINDFVKFIAKEATVELKGYTRDGKKKKKIEL